MVWPAPYVPPTEPEAEVAPELRDLADKAEAEAAAQAERDVELWSVG